MWPLIAQATSSGGWTDVIDNLARTPLSKVVIFVAVCTALRLAIAPVIARTPAHKHSGLYTAVRIFNEAMDAIVYAGVFVFLLIRPFCIQAFKIPSGSMLDTLQIDDFIVANKAIYRYSNPKDGDIVVFRPPKIAVSAKDIDKDGQVNVDFIKRCVGVPGDIVEVKDGVLYRNGKPQTEPYVKSRPDTDFKLVKYKNEYWPLLISGVYVNSGGTAPRFHLGQPGEPNVQLMDELRKLPAEPVPKDSYLMMGDNRAESFDSRFWGLVPRESIIGRAEFIWMPISRWRITR